MKIKGQEYLLPVVGVGSWPRPTWFKGRVFGTRTEPDFPSFAVREMFEDATRLCIDDQERIGVTVPYGPPIAAFLTKVSQITVVDELKWVRPIFGPALEVVRKYTTKPV